jgi:hypothetical protein
LDHAAKAAREMTPLEWAKRLCEDGWVANENEVAHVIAVAIERGQIRERRECADLAREHSHTITEETVSALGIGKDMDEQQRIDLASTMRHVAQYVGVLISQRNPKPPKGQDTQAIVVAALEAAIALVGHVVTGEVTRDDSATGVLASYRLQFADALDALKKQK